MLRQSPIDIKQDGYDDAHTILDDPSFELHYKKVSGCDMLESPNSGPIIWTLKDGGNFKTDLTKLWYPDIDFTFTPKQFHFHRGFGISNKSDTSDDGSEHTIDGQHFQVEMHIVNLNQNQKT